MRMNELWSALFVRIFYYAFIYFRSNMWQLLYKAGLFMTCLLWTFAAANSGPVYVAVDGTAVLHLGSAVTGNITTVTWKHDADKAAELYGGEVTYYRQFKGRCELNIMTGELTINHLNLSDGGFYSAEINGYEVNTVHLWVMYPVPKPSVSTWCDATNTYCLLTCEGTSSVPEADKYLWNKEKEHSSSMKVLNITEENKEPEFSCEIKNPVSSSRSDPVQNPFITGGSSISSSAGYPEDPVPKPSVSTWCDATKTYCLLTCEGTSSVPESLQYRWNEENDWSHSMKVLNITKENMEPEFSCEIKNPVSSSRSDPVQNPFITAPVPKPSVSTWCDATKTYCLLTCEGTSSVPESLQYRWNEENDWSNSMKVLNITKENKEPEFSCEIKNPVNSSISDPVQNPFITGGSSVSTVSLILGVILPILLAVAVAVVLYCKRNGKKTAAGDGVQPSLWNLWSCVRDLFPRSRTTDPENQGVQPVTYRPGEAGDEGEPGVRIGLLSETENGGVLHLSNGAANNHPAATSSSANGHHEPGRLKKKHVTSHEGSDHDEQPRHEGPDQEEQPGFEGQDEEKD